MIFDNDLAEDWVAFRYEGDGPNELQWVGVDRSTGPMSSGGYPTYHDDVKSSELFKDPDSAKKYAKACGSLAKNWVLYVITITPQPFKENT